MTVILNKLYCDEINNSWRFDWNAQFHGKIKCLKEKDSPSRLIKAIHLTLC